MKIRTFQTYIAPIFLYNSELWSTNKSTETLIDSFHRKQLRYPINHHWPKKKSNIDLYQVTKAEPWSKTIRRRRLNWLGDLMRLNENTPARRALDVALTPSQRPVGRTTTRWIDTIKADLEKNSIKIILKNKQETLNTLILITNDRKQWKYTVKALMQ